MQKKIEPGLYFAIFFALFTLGGALVSAKMTGEEKRRVHACLNGGGVVEKIVPSLFKVEVHCSKSARQ